MKQVLQNYRTGIIELAEVPVPHCPSNKILVQNVSSLISIGTERSLIELGRKSILGKAKTRPDLVKRFMDKAKKEGLLKTYKEALGRLDTPTSLGYSSSGVVVEVGNSVHKFSVGDRVACIGAGYASHAEYITVPENLCCKIHNNITFEEASFGMLGIIAIHGIRCAQLNFGETVAVIGLGLLGLLSIQILKAYGCNVVGFDVDPSKTEIAQKLNIDNMFTSIDDFKNKVERITNGCGADATIITAATNSNVPVNTSVNITRYRGKIVIVGVVDIHPNRNEMWHNEVEIIVSKGGGPGTLDPLYENKGIDYPVGYTRWTENRNLDEFLRLMALEKIDVKLLITHRFSIERAEKVYSDMLDNRGGPYIGVVLTYPYTDSYRSTEKKMRYINISTTQLHNTSSLSVAVIGAGLFGKSLLLPSLKKIKNIRFHSIATSSGTTAYHTLKQYKFENCTTDYSEVLKNKEIDVVIILTPHSAHARMVIEALQAGKHVFVEKPICINETELQKIREMCVSIYSKQSLPFIMVGYNRRFSPHAQKVKEYLKNRTDPLVIHYRVNAGFVPAEHWVHSEEEGGSRIVGEVCHFVDILQYFTGSNPVRVYAERISGNNKTALNSDNVSIILKFGDGSIGSIVYTACGDKAYSRENIEIFCEGKTIVLNDYKKTDVHYSGKVKTFKTFNQKLGYEEELQYFVDILQGQCTPLFTIEDIFYSTMTVFKIQESIDSGKAEAIYI